MVKVLFAPAHYIYDNSQIGSEVGWAYAIADRIASRNPGSIVLTGSRSSRETLPYDVIELMPNKTKLDLSLKNASIFNAKYSYGAWRASRKNRFNIVHHILPFGIGNTFNLFFVIGRRKPGQKFVVGPVQNQLSYYDADVVVSDVRSTATSGGRPKKTPMVLRIFQPLLGRLSMATLRKADAIVVINEYTRSSLSDRGIDRSKITIIPPGIDCAKFSVAPFPVGRGTVNLLVVAYLIKRKAVDHIIRALAEVADKHKNIRLTIVGDGPELPVLRQLADELNVSSYIKFVGRVRHSEVPEFFKQANVYVNMSRAEGFATVCLEAMASGLAIVSSRVGGFSDAVKPGVHGYLVEQEDYRGLARKLEQLISEPNRIVQFGKAARVEAERTYDWDTAIIPKYVQLYRALM